MRGVPEAVFQGAPPSLVRSDIARPHPKARLLIAKVDGDGTSLLILLHGAQREQLTERTKAFGDQNRNLSVCGPLGGRLLDRCDSSGIVAELRRAVHLGKNPKEG